MQKGQAYILSISLIRQRRSKEDINYARSHRISMHIKVYQPLVSSGVPPSSSAVSVVFFDAPLMLRFALNSCTPSSPCNSPTLPLRFLALLSSASPRWSPNSRISLSLSNSSATYPLWVLSPPPSSGALALSRFLLYSTVPKAFSVKGPW